MPPALLDSQLLTLEPTASDEQAIELDIDEAPEVLARRASQALEALTA
jgi:gluconate kinase